MDIIRRVLELADTCLEGLEHAETCLKEGRFEDGIMMLHDTMHGYYQMEKALEPVLVNLPDTEIRPHSETLRNVLEHLVPIQERGEWAKALELMQFNVVPTYKKWHAELNRRLRPYVTS